MYFLPREVYEYAQAHSTVHSPLLHRLERETHLSQLHPQMLTGSLQLGLLRLLVRLLLPRRVLEVGTFTGYAAIGMAEVLPTGATLTTIEVNDELEPLVRHYIAEAGLQHCIELLVGDAKQIVPTLKDTFDLVYLDAAKNDYCHYLQLLSPRISSGGLLVTDNVLWNGKVLPPITDKEALLVDEFNKMLLAHPDFEVLLLPLRDGVSVARKR